MPVGVIQAQAAANTAALAQMIANQQSAELRGQMRNQLCLGPENMFGMLQNAAPPLPPKWITDRKIERGERLIDRMAFWTGVPVVGQMITARLADDLEAICDELEAA